MATQAQVKNWINSHIGKSVNPDGVYGPQCMDLIVQYGLDFFNHRFTGNAIDLWTQPLPKGWKRIKNTPSFVPKLGDIGVYSIGQYGHTGIETGKATTGSHQSLDQNWVNASSKGSPAALVSHDYSNYLGVLRPPLTGESDMYKGHSAAYWYKKYMEAESNKNIWRARYIGYLRDAGKKLASIPAKIRNVVK